MNPQNAAPAREYFGPYEILEAVGRGGMGVVYRAHDPALGRTVALKVLRDDLRLQSPLVARFQREAKAVASLNHPNIVHIYSVGAVDEIPYIAMEYIEGVPLSRLLQAGQRLHWQRALYLAEQVANALCSAHERGIIHRDIKPANVLVAGGDRVYLTDFGVAKVLSAETQLTVQGARLGTPEYMAPERCEKDEPTAASDIYSLGVALFQMITGRLPFDAKSNLDLLRKMVWERPARVREFAPEVPEDVERLVAWMLERQPANRPASALILAEAMARVRTGMPLDEEGPNLASALAEFRDSFATPTPAPGGGTAPRRRSRFSAACGAVKRMLAKHAPGILYTLGVLALCAVGAWSYIRAESRLLPRALTAAQNLGAWRDGGPAGRVIRTGKRERWAELRLPGYRIEAVTWAGGLARVRARRTDSMEARVAIDPVTGQVNLEAPPGPGAIEASESAPPLDAFTYALSPDGSQLLASRRVGNEWLLEWTDVPSGQIRAEFPGAQLGAWHPSGNFFVCLAESSDGRPQLRAVSARATRRSRALTDLPGGAGAICSISADGRWAATAAEGGTAPAVVFVDLSGIELEL